MKKETPTLVKVGKYNPKKNKTCVGQYLVGLYSAMNNILKEQETTGADVQAAAWAMNMTMLEITQQWCKCPWCKRTGARIEEHLKGSKVEEKE